MSSTKKAVYPPFTGGQEMNHSTFTCSIRTREGLEIHRQETTIDDFDFLHLLHFTYVPPTK